jgi:hypothetical protein
MAFVSARPTNSLLSVGHRAILLGGFFCAYAGCYGDAPASCVVPIQIVLALPFVMPPCGLPWRIDGQNANASTNET